MTHNEKKSGFEVVIIGAGHAGCEAALVASRRGVRTLLITSNIDRIAAMSCNPSIGGLGKGHLVKEIDALGGEMAKVIDATGIQFRRLNTTKGTAVQGTRAQADMYLYSATMRNVLEAQPNLFIRQGTVKSLFVRAGAIFGVELLTGEQIETVAVVVTAGTFLKAICHIGLSHFPGGRAGDTPSNDLSDSLANDCGLEIIRLKTGTVPRLDGKTINWAGLEPQQGDTPIPLFSFSPTQNHLRQVSCYITHTNKNTHDIIRADLDKSPLFQGVIKGRGPRYCPSIEDKVVRFAERERHQIFLEPEGLMTNEVYPNGISTSLPLETQINFVRSISGLENAHIQRPGYAVEYDAINPLELKTNYETKKIQGLFLAGQVNGTSGYEEAAAQGLMAGINAVQFINDLPPVVIGRDQGYIGVMTDDLVTKGVGGEPYRMFTSRAEYRLMLREDNADVRLRQIGFDLGLVSEADFIRFQKKMETFSKLKSFAKETCLKEETSSFYRAIRPSQLNSVPEVASLEQMIKWPDVQVRDFEAHWPELNSSIDFDTQAMQLLFSETRYQGYIERHSRDIERMKVYDDIKIPKGLEYANIPCLSNEVRERLGRAQPETLGQAMRIPGVTPAAMAHFEIFLANKNRSR